MPSSRGSSRPIEPVSPTSPALQADFFTYEAPGKPSQYHTGKQILELGLMIAIHWTKHTCLYSSTFSLTGTPYHGSGLLPRHSTAIVLDTHNDTLDHLLLKK